MSESEQPKKAGATFLWVLGAFAGFAVLFSIIQSVAGNDTVVDPRAPERLAAREEIAKAQDAHLTALGFKDAAKKTETFNKVLSSLKGKAPAASTQLVPGSPTQLKQAAAAAPAAPAPPAPAPAK